MPQFRPFPPYHDFDDLGFDEVDMVEEQSPEVIPNLPPVATSPVDLFSGQQRGVTTDQFSALPGMTTGALTAMPGARTDSLAKLPGLPVKPSAMPSLTAALQSTMTTNTTGRMVVIPGVRKDKRAGQEKASSTRRLSSRLRHTVVLVVTLLLAIITLLSLSPLTNGQPGFPILGGIREWVQAQQANWQITAHMDMTQAKQNQNNGSNSTAGLPPMRLPKSQYIAIAQQDAINAGISPVYFVRQINQESGFNPNAVSPAGAVGIAQFLPSTAAGLGIDPWNPIDALRGAARLMAGYAKNYGGDYAKALAAYNGGSGTVQRAVNNCGANWLNCLPGETRSYIHIIMGI